MASHAEVCRKCKQAQWEAVHQPLDVSQERVAWIAGILEGEGTWSETRQAWYVKVSMTDLDIIERLQEWTGVGRITEWRSPAAYHKTVYTWRVDAKIHREWLTLLVWPWLGERRKKRIRQLWPDASVVLMV